MIPYNGPCRLTSPFGHRINPITGGAELHKGVDLVGTDKAIISPAAGTVTISTIGKECGNQIAVKTADGYTLFFCHLNSRAVFLHENINAGDVIGIEGATGQVTGRHLHFEVWQGDRLTGKLINAAEWLGIENKIGECQNMPKEIEILTEPNDIVWELSHRGILKESDKWVEKINSDNDIYCILKNTVQYMREHDV